MKKAGPLPRPDSSASYFSILWALFDDASRGVEIVERELAVAGEGVKLRFAGEALVERLLPPLEHLAAATAISLTIQVWDETTGSPPSRRRLGGRTTIGTRTEVSGLDEGFHASYDIGDGVFCMIDLSAGRAVFHTRFAGTLPLRYRGSPFLVLFHWWFEHRGLALVHGGAVGTPDGAVLLTGKGGSGKSTTALSCVGSNLGYLNDDYSVVSSGPLSVHSLYSSGKLEPGHLQKFPRLVPRAVGSADDEKRVIYLFRHWPEALLATAPLRAVVLPRVTGGRTRWESASPGAALRALAPSTLAQLPGAGAAAFRSMAGVVARVPSYFLNLGPDLAEILEAVTSLLEAVPR